MNRHHALGFIRRLLDDGFMRGYLEQAIGYDSLAKIRDIAMRPGNDLSGLKPLVDYLREVCEEVGK